MPLDCKSEPAHCLMRRAFRLTLLSLLAFGLACADQDEVLPIPMAERPSPAAQALVTATLATHGSHALDRAELAFAFRGTPFTVRRHEGRFRYARTLTDSLGRTVEEVVDNDGVHRFVDGAEVPLDPAAARRVETAVNSVAYFALLPLPLRDPAVQPRALGPDTIRGEPYERLEVTFDEDGGGRDYEDRYLYWLHADRHTVDYLAYTYELGANETGPNATGSRFREVIGVHEISGVRLQDYRNLTADVGDALERYPTLYEADSLRVVSEVVLDSVRVTPAR